MVCLLQQKLYNRRHPGWLSSGGLSLSLVRFCVRAHALVLAYSPLPGLWGPFILSLRQSLELDTGVNHHSLALCFTAHLRTRSPPSACRFPTPPSPQYPLVSKYLHYKLFVIFQVVTPLFLKRRKLFPYTYMEVLNRYTIITKKLRFNFSLLTQFFAGCIFVK